MMDNKSMTTATPELIKYDHTSIEQLHEDKSDAQQKGGTVHDDRDMVRMGKTQQLRVSMRLAA